MRLCINIAEKKKFNFPHNILHKKPYKNPYKKLWVLLSVSMLSMLCLSACSKAENEPDKAVEITDTIYERGLLEQAVDWCNSKLFDVKQDYDIFTLEQRIEGEKEYNFLIKQEPDGNNCDLYYLQCEDGQLRKVISCGGGEKSLFSYEIVKIHGEDYTAVYCADEDLNGDLKLYPLSDTGKVYIIEDVINNNREPVTNIDEDGLSYTKSQFYSTGKLKAKFIYLNHDIYTDIRLIGYIYEYIQYPRDDYPMLTNIYKCTKTYYYDKKQQQFVLQNDKQSLAYTRIPSGFDYTGYMDEHPQLARDNPQYDYDGDGLMDRIYKDINIYTKEGSFYVHFGNGNKLLLTDRQYGFLYRTYAADLTGDGVNEIIFEQFSSSSKSSNLYYSIASYKDGAYELMDIPYFHADPGSEEYGPMLYLPLIMNKVDADKVSIYQPDSGYKGYITTEATIMGDGEVYDEMEHLFPASEMENRLGFYQIDNMQLVDTGQDGKKAFLLRSLLGDKWCSKSVDWRLEYISGEWKITGVYQADPIRVKVGTDFNADLDGDKTEDKIYYGIHTVTVNGNKVDTPVLKINGTEYDRNFLQDKLGVNITNCNKDNYYIIDINTADNYRELAILDEDINGDPGCHLFRFNGYELKYCGYVSGIPDDTLRNQGNGEIIARKRLDIMQNRYTFVNWKQNAEGVLEEVEQSIYSGLFPYSDESIRYNAVSEFTLYMINDMKSDTVTINEGEVIWLSATDNKNWIEITAESGKSGWFYLEGNKVITPGGEGKPEEIAPNLK